MWVLDEQSALLTAQPARQFICHSEICSFHWAMYWIDWLIPCWLGFSCSLYIPDIHPPADLELTKIFSHSECYLLVPSEFKSVLISWVSVANCWHYFLSKRSSIWKVLDCANIWKFPSNVFSFRSYMKFFGSFGIDFCSKIGTYLYSSSVYIQLPQNCLLMKLPYL